jgi:hypothetical protein
MRDHGDETTHQQIRVRHFGRISRNAAEMAEHALRVSRTIHRCDASHPSG